MLKHLFLCAAGIGALAAATPLPATAQTPSKPGAETNGTVPAGFWDTFKLTGYVNAGITGNVDDPADRRITFGRLFDDRSNHPLLNQAGIVAERAQGWTWLVYLVAALFFVLTAASYMEAASLHQERGGVTVIARYAFTALAWFIAGWASMLDYVILIALTAFTSTD